MGERKQKSGLEIEQAAVSVWYQAIRWVETPTSYLPDYHHQYHHNLPGKTHEHSFDK